MPGVCRRDRGDYARMLFYFACEAAGASSARHSLRPLNFRCASSSAKTRAHRAARSRRCGCVSAKMDTHVPKIIGGLLARSERDEAIHPCCCCSMDCFACARNDGANLIVRAVIADSTAASAVVIPPTCGEGGAKRRVGVVRERIQPPTRHIVRAAHDVPPSPQSGRDKKKWEG
jgi:hypothetical protein